MTLIISYYFPVSSSLILPVCMHINTTVLVYLVSCVSVFHLYWKYTIVSTVILVYVTELNITTGTGSLLLDHQTDV